MAEFLVELYVPETDPAAAGITDLGKNKASANGDPEQCSAGVVACS